MSDTDRKSTIWFFIRGPLLIAVLFALGCVGAAIFLHVEKGVTDRLYVEEQQNRIAQRSLVIQHLQSHNLRIDRGILEELLRTYESRMGVLKDYEGLKDHWSFWNAFYYSLTTFTTIGYGNIIVRTDSGRALTAIYALIGIPLFVLAIYYNAVLVAWLLRVAVNFVLKGRRRSYAMSEILPWHKPTHCAAPLLAWFAVAAWPFVCAGIIHCYEVADEWPYKTSLYYYINSLATIGYGDAIPVHVIAGCLTMLLVFFNLVLIVAAVLLTKWLLKTVYFNAVSLAWNNTHDWAAVYPVTPSDRLEKQADCWLGTETKLAMLKKFEFALKQRTSETGSCSTPEGGSQTGAKKYSDDVTEKLNQSRPETSF